MKIIARLSGRTGQQVTMAIMTSVALSAVMITGCQPTDRRPEPVRPPQTLINECATEDAPGPCTWHADRHGDGSGLSFDVSAEGEVRYWGPADYKRYHAS